MAFHNMRKSALHGNFTGNNYQVVYDITNIRPCHTDHSPTIASRAKLKITSWQHSTVFTCFHMSFLFQRQISVLLLNNLTSPMAAWDPFLDPADDGPQDLKVELDRHPDPVLKDVPLDPWNDCTFVALAQEAAREAEERYEAAMKVLEMQQEAERKESEAKEARRLKLEKEAREIAKLSIQEPYRITLGYCWEVFLVVSKIRLI